MSSDDVTVFFYGLFMDRSVLASKGIVPSRARLGYVEGYALRIGRRATLLEAEARRAYGVVMTLRAEEATALYADESVADYVSEPVMVVHSDGTTTPAVCYSLPADKLSGTNPEYARSLLALAEKLGLPEGYREEIRRQID